MTWIVYHITGKSVISEMGDSEKNQRICFILQGKPRQGIARSASCGIYLPKLSVSVFLRTGELRDDAAHDMRIRSRQCFADPEQEIHLRWRELYFAWFVPVSKFDAATVSA